MESPARAALRARIFDLLPSLVHPSEIIDRQSLLDFTVDGESLPLIDYSRGIRNPRQLDATLSVVSSANGPYDDMAIAPGVWRYDFRSGGPGGDNRKLIEAAKSGAPLILFRKLEPKVYQAIYPVRVAAVNEPESHVIITLDELTDLADHEPSAVERKWAEYLAERRVHQPAFRTMVLRAYATQCTVCRFKHSELLDAAHILSDKHEQGHAIVTNGMAMCKIHHAAYDRRFLGIDPDYRVHINDELLAEVDGPMLKHGLQEMHGSLITLPSRAKDRPARDALAARFAEFSSRN